MTGCLMLNSFVRVVLNAGSEDGMVGKKFEWTNATGSESPGSRRHGVSSAKFGIDNKLDTR
jgi:hypothetical protein